MRQIWRSRRISPVHSFQLITLQTIKFTVMCRTVFSRNRNTCLRKYNLSFMYRKSPTNIINEVHRFFTSTIKSKECQPTYQEPRALGLQGCAKSHYRYTVFTQLHWILAANCLQDSGECMRLSPNKWQIVRYKVSESNTLRWSATQNNALVLTQNRRTHSRVWAAEQCYSPTDSFRFDSFVRNFHYLLVFSDFLKSFFLFITCRFSPAELYESCVNAELQLLLRIFKSRLFLIS